MEIGGWLRSLGLEQYEAAFRENAIDDAVPPSVTAEDQKEGSCRKTFNCHSGAQFASRAALYKSCPARKVSDLNSRRINYRQEKSNLSPEPKSPSSIGQLSYPVAAFYRPHRLKGAVPLHVAFNVVSLVVREYHHLGDGVTGQHFDTESLYYEASFIYCDRELWIGRCPNPAHGIYISLSRKRT